MNGQPTLSIANDTRASHSSRPSVANSSCAMAASCCAFSSAAFCFLRPVGRPLEETLGHVHTGATVCSAFVLSVARAGIPVGVASRESWRTTSGGCGRLLSALAWVWLRQVPYRRHGVRLSSQLTIENCLDFHSGFRCSLQCRELDRLAFRWFRGSVRLPGEEREQRCPWPGCLASLGLPTVCCTLRALSTARHGQTQLMREKMLLRRELQELHPPPPEYQKTLFLSLSLSLSVSVSQCLCLSVPVSQCLSLVLLLLLLLSPS